MAQESFKFEVKFCIDFSWDNKICCHGYGKTLK